MTQGPIDPVLVDAPVPKVTIARDLAAKATEVGLFFKYDVERRDRAEQDPESKHYGGCDYFVLDLDHDPYARPAIAAYIEACRPTHPHLAADLEAKIAPPPIEAAAILLAEVMHHTLTTYGPEPGTVRIPTTLRAQIAHWLTDNAPTNTTDPASPNA